MIDPIDDLGTAKKPYNVIACIPVYGRIPLVRQTIRRLYKKNGCYRVICVGDIPEDKIACTEEGAIWINHCNKPLGSKWNSCFLKAKEYNVDACLFVGSSDFVSDNWLTTMRPYVEQHGFAGVPGCYMADLAETIRCINWKGYKTCRPERANETIGIGRMLSRRLIEAMDWKPFDPNLDNSLDWSMKVNAKKYGFTDYMVHDERLKALSVSTNQWQNKHRFELHWNNMVPSEKVDSELIIKDFPELIQVFK